ncbi:HypC/HybG/HupF family hydrogenase formation chaperone [Acidianus manzaensis]|uniref:Hydrogenase maturation factor n=1 Tax=Acidianus manzaensis TaxID=282676 RepID=A0A1W6JYG0_9CREN|nr:HypC/HybG/HupF family hydrogenase formation chaperone [Acidianus manzaensis]ARM75351.1 hydrogenase maturation factor [Acidianus manzaensis]
MCLSFPAKVVDIQDLIVFVDYGNNTIEPVINNMVDDLNPGDYVVISYGMIIQKISKEEYDEMIKYETEMAKVLANNE